MREEIVENKIAVLNRPKFGREIERSLNLRANYIKGRAKCNIKWG